MYYIHPGLTVRKPSVVVVFRKTAGTETPIFTGERTVTSIPREVWEAERDYQVLDRHGLPVVELE